MRPAPALAALFAALATLAALALAAPASAQEDVDAGYEVRLARGDIPTTEPAEPAGAWNLRLELVLDGGAQNVTFPLPAGFDVASGGAGCTCPNATTEPTASTVTVRAPAGTAPGSTAFLAATMPAGRVLALELPLPDAARPEDAFLAVYAPADHAVDSDLDLAHMDCAEGDCELYFHEASAGAPLPTTLWLTVHPAGAAADPVPTDDDGFGGRGWLALAAGVLAGILLWALLVQRGVVQKRARKQVAAEAPHDALAKEGRPALEARKRALMAALKELELAKMNQEVEVPAYDAVKADLKKQTVAVMRALEQAPA